MKKNLLFLMLGQVISVFGGAILRFALSLYVLDQTGRADIFATILAISSIPVLFAPIGGVIADRFNRRNLMVMMDVANAVLAVGLYFVLGMDQAIVLIGILLFVLSIVGSFDTPVVTASIPLLVEHKDLEKVNGLVNSVLALSNVAAPIIGGILYSLMGVETLVISTTVFFVLAAAVESLLKIPFEKRPMENGAFKTLTKDLKEGFLDVKNNRVIRNAVGIAALINFSLSSFFVVGIPIVLRVILNANDSMYGIGMAMISLSTIIGALMTGYFSKKLSLKTLYMTFLLSGILLMVMNLGLLFAGSGVGQVVSWIVFFATGIPIGMLMSIISVYLISMIQRITPKHNLGKIMAIIVGASQCAMPIGQMVVGLLLKQTNNQVFFPVTLIVIIIVLISVWCFQLFKDTVDTDVQYRKKTSV
ncbi:ABC transporter permease [Enterococcus sp. JM4C]|uniref:MFS transporter n=1 Tax=Candidatus Enterococcus huntleyi TaxID=1857217 RepID=UPI00137B0DDC|nr:MFS transporter [Enterococcus sp. JM4C]KAF1295581.1 ABC transporter permease [Enterococcus sp. JM4C]